MQTGTRTRVFNTLNQVKVMQLTDACRSTVNSGTVVALGGMSDELTKAGVGVSSREVTLLTYPRIRRPLWLRDINIGIAFWLMYK